ncbi:winged helix-turn-helix transcriptional regulator [Mesorhizobium intechi]|uniref:MarR family winged helix-turn-helix transcriptional regulator n=1 Tax=Mesorhizobium intechi TaxID=537601 RepID=UPI000CBC00BB|nr:MarR family winged helix-turn-helix transcriptional regulator [Mesorhizobium intechi]TSE13405.1 winged helix-turn-helix transcriptional regulator [Mesorhizobium intechi]
MSNRKTNILAEMRVSKLEHLIGYHLRRASLLDLQGVAAALETVNTRIVPMSVLAVMVEYPGTTSAQICRILGMQRANIVSILAELEARGLFFREVDSSDQRVQRLFPTQRGAEESSRWLNLLAEHERHMFGRLSDREQAELRRLLSKLWQEDEPRPV